MRWIQPATAARRSRAPSVDAQASAARGLASRPSNHAGFPREGAQRGLAPSQHGFEVRVRAVREEVEFDHVLGPAAARQVEGGYSGYAVGPEEHLSRFVRDGSPVALEAEHAFDAEAVEVREGPGLPEGGLARYGREERLLLVMGESEQPARLARPAAHGDDDRGRLDRERAALAGLERLARAAQVALVRAARGHGAGRCVHLEAPAPGCPGGGDELEPAADLDPLAPAGAQQRVAHRLRPAGYGVEAAVRRRRHDAEAREEGVEALLGPAAEDGARRGVVAIVPGVERFVGDVAAAVSGRQDRTRPGTRRPARPR